MALAPAGINKNTGPAPLGESRCSDANYFCGSLRSPMTVDRCKANICHFVDLFQFLHGQLTDAHAGDFTVVGAEQRLLNAAYRTLQRFVADRPLGAGTHHGVEQLLPVERLTGAVLFDDHKRNSLHDLIGRKAHMAAQAFAAAADALTVFGGAGIDHFGFLGSAIGTLHVLFLLSGLTGLCF